MTDMDTRIPLWRQLQATAVVIQAVREGQSGTAAIDAVPSEVRAAVQSLAFHVWRNLGRAEALRKILASRAPPAGVDALLCVALALAWSEVDAPYDAFTLVNQAVEAAKHTPSAKAQANFVNACLRRFLREKASLVARTDHDPVAVWNHPIWWIEQLKRDHPGQWQAILSASNAHAPMTLRVNVRKSTPQEYMQVLADAGIAARPTGVHAVVLEKPLAVHRIPGFAQGEVSVQDAAGQMAAPMLLAGLQHSAGLRVLDACAAPGGKTGHLLELVEADVTALEIDPRRCARISENLTRLGLQARVLTADALDTGAWWDGALLDAILLDAPCTASGIVRRHPDVRWLRRPSDIPQLAALQKKMLDTLWPLLKPGGRLLYCTCSLFVAEGDAQVQTFLARHTDAILLPSVGHLMPVSDAKVGELPDNRSGDHDGFFFALLQKRMAC